MGPSCDQADRQHVLLVPRWRRIIPTYNFRKEDGTVYTEFMSFSAVEQYCLDNGVEQVLSAPMIVTGVNQKPDNGFRDVLKRIKKANINSTIDTF
jgi:hypothetical protein